jgi:hypothetical protein
MRISWAVFTAIFELLLGALIGAPAIAADPLTGSVDYAGHQMSWSVGGASAAPTELADRYDGVVQVGATVTFSGSMTFSLGPHSATNLSQYASLSGAKGVSFSQRVGEGTYTTPFSLTTTATGNGTTGVVGSLSATVSSRNCNDWGLCAGPTVTIDLAVVRGPVTPQKGQKQMVAAAYRCLGDYLQAANGHRFSKWTSRGSKDIYRSTLLGLVIDVNPGNLRGTANAQYLDGVVTVRKDPRTLTAAECTEFGKTLWEEVSHAIEDAHGDVGYTDSEDRKEARVDYMLEMDETANILIRLEHQARKGAPVGKLAKIWTLYAKNVKAARAKAISRGYIPSPKELKQWFGWEMSGVQIKKKYLSGMFLPGPAGKNLRKALS